jgi:hypothetical protein
MKIRSGFISNSSSSSFVIVGATLTKQLEKKLIDQLELSQREIDEEGISEILGYKSGLDVLHTGGSAINCYSIGKLIADGLDDMDVESMSMTELMNHIKKVKKILGDEEDIKLIYGCRPS